MHSDALRQQATARAPAGFKGLYSTRRPQNILACGGNPDTESGRAALETLSAVAKPFRRSTFKPPAVLPLVSSAEGGNRRPAERGINSRFTNSHRLFLRSPGLVSVGLRVYGRGMKNSRSSAPVEPEKLKPVLHEKIDRMNDEQLALLDRVLLQLEAEQAAERLGEAFDADHAQGKLARVAELVRQFRAEHRYA